MKINIYHIENLKRILFTYKATKEGPSTGGGSTNDYNPFQYG
jgi:hypothetical protein